MAAEDHPIFMRDLRTNEDQRSAASGRQILVLSERAALFERSSGNAADWTRIYLSVRSTLRSLSRDARTSHPMRVRTTSARR